jgi:anthranilate synthase component 1
MQLTIHPTFADVAAQRAGGKVVPVWAEAVADVETPISAFAKLGNDAPSFLLESAETTDLTGRFSFVGIGFRTIISAFGKTVTIKDASGTRVVEVDDDPLAELERILSTYRADPHPELPGCWGGAVGYIAFDAVRWIEPTIPEPPPDSLHVPDLFFVIPEIIVIFDHHKRRIRVVRSLLPGDGETHSAYQEAKERIRSVFSKLAETIPFTPLFPMLAFDPPNVHSNTTRDEYYEMVLKAKEYIKAGDIFQIVPSQRFSTAYAGDALDLYRALRFINPSPYMFCLRCGDGLNLVGCSPEVHVRLTGDLVEIRPIAGTRRRGETPEEDSALVKDLLADAKERAEHLMLVDLARNDIGRIARYGTVQVSDFMTVEKYSHVMHIVSHVSGRLDKGKTAFDVMRATFPAGTVTGAPKVRAMQILNTMEKNKRCVYSGAVGYFRFDGDSDSCIALRTIVLKDGQAYVQAGGGVVADSTPEGEYQETVNKARAALRAVALAGTIGR